MLRGHRLAITVVLGLLCRVGAVWADTARMTWVDMTRNIREREVRAIAIDPEDPRTIFAGTSRAIYRSVDGGRTWSARLTSHGARAVHTIHMHPTTPTTIYAGTADGVFRSDDHGDAWKRVTSGRLDRQACWAVLVDASSDAMTRVWAGTASGLWWSDDGGRQWTAATGRPAHEAIYALAQDPQQPQRVYAATDTALLLTTDRGAHWRVVLQATVTREEVADTPRERPAAADSLTARRGYITDLVIDARDTDRLLVATRDGPLVSHDQGHTWQSLSRSGLFGTELYDLLLTHASPTYLFAASSRGVSLFDEATQRWAALTHGLTAQQIYALAVQPQDGSLWAATDRGVFHGVVVEATATAAQSPLALMNLFHHEPMIHEVHQMVTQYTNTDPEKIARWRRQASTRALLPTLRFGFDRDVDISDRIDEGAYPTFQQVPVRSLDRGWDVSMTWDLSELLWNDDQLAIDSRSKLMTELRRELLDDVTRLYFERRRLQVEGVLHPVADAQLAFEHDWRIRELTAQLDALTGGDFSRALEGTP